jgi:5-formyltetrahydrofolate cyclo-ligase
MLAPQRYLAAMFSPLQESKRQLRREMSRLRREVPAELAAQAAEAATASLTATGAARQARRVALYAALPGELPTRPLFDAVVKEYGAALLPRSLDPVGLEFCSVERWEDLQPGYFGVLEPAKDAPVVVLSSEDLVVVPGLAFDEQGYRVGQGKGYYDRAFPEGAGDGPTLLGFCYEFQVVDAVPYDERDRRLDGIVTEQAVRNCTESLR